MTLAEVLESELGVEFVEAAEESGHEPAEVLASMLKNFIVVMHADVPPVRVNPGVMPQSQKDALAAMSGLWAGRDETGAEIAQRVREANRRVESV